MTWKLKAGFGGFFAGASASTGEFFAEASPTMGASATGDALA